MVGKDGEARTLRLDLLGPTERKRLITPAGEPMALWLNEQGCPMTAEAWAAVFRRASVRCWNPGMDPDGTPPAPPQAFPAYSRSSFSPTPTRAVLPTLHPPPPPSPPHP